MPARAAGARRASRSPRAPAPPQAQLRGFVRRAACQAVRRRRRLEPPARRIASSAISTSVDPISSTSSAVLAAARRAAAISSSARTSVCLQPAEPGEHRAERGGRSCSNSSLSSVCVGSVGRLVQRLQQLESGRGVAQAVRQARRASLVRGVELAGARRQTPATREARRRRSEMTGRQQVDQQVLEDLGRSRREPRRPVLLLEDSSRIARTFRRRSLAYSFDLRPGGTRSRSRRGSRAWSRSPPGCTTPACASGSASISLRRRQRLRPLSPARSLRSAPSARA